MRTIEAGATTSGSPAAVWALLADVEYELLDGMRMRGYRSAVTLEEGPHDGAVVRWRSTYDHAGPLAALVLRLAVRDACKRLAKAASA